MPSESHNLLRVLFITAEADPFIKIGGLGDYSGSLPKAIADIKTNQIPDIDIRVVLPYLNGVETVVPPLKTIAKIAVETKRGFAKGLVYQFIYNDIVYYLIKRSGNPSGYREVYNLTQAEDARKYIFFSLACIELIKAIHWVPDIVHANDWHTAISVYQLDKKRKTNRFFQSVRSLLAIHNLPFLGEGSQSTLNEYQIYKMDSKEVPGWAQTLPLPMGLVKADEIVAVSPSYAEELREEEFGDGLTEFFLKNTRKITGILNGIDTSIWEPETDEYLFQNYSKNQLNKRTQNKVDLLKQSGLKNQSEKPLLVLISRLTGQKGIDILLEGLPLLFNKEWTAIFLGTGQPEYEHQLLALESLIPDRFKVFLGFDSALAHRLYSSGDILLMPSLYEPCGLSQMIAMHYGCLPVARAVGGLKDSITDYPLEEKTGYLFEKANGPAFADCLCRALSDYKVKKKWESIQKRAMSEDFSWKRSATQYINLYKSMLSDHKK